MRYIEALTEYEPEGLPSLFLAGGITGCPGWQETVVRQLKEEAVVILNPRRANFPIDDPTAAQTQIKWEHRHLRKADAVLFWFPSETLCPITLYELGSWSMTTKPLFVGVHPDYQRRQDVEIQTRLVRPEVKVHYDLVSVADAARNWIAKC